MKKEYRTRGYAPLPSNFPRGYKNALETLRQESYHNAIRDLLDVVSPYLDDDTFEKVVAIAIPDMAACSLFHLQKIAKSGICQRLLQIRESRAVNAEGQ